jgi:hypothetical protein
MVRAYFFKRFSIHPSVYRATVVSGPWSPSEGTSIPLYPQMVSSNLVFLDFVVLSSIYESLPRQLCAFLDINYLRVEVGLTPNP